MNLDDLKKSVSDLSDDELQNLIRDIRVTRRTPVSKPKAASTIKSAKPVSQDLSLATLMAGMTKEQAEVLLKQLEKGN